MRKLSLVLLCIVAMSGSAWADLGTIVSDAWSRATPAGAASAVVYFTVSSPGDRLIGASTPVAAKAELHQTTMENGIMKMAPVTGGIAIDGTHPFKASPNGYHLMLTGLKQPLKGGDTFPLTLVFEKAGQVSTDVTVRPSVMDSMPGKMDGMDMSH